MYCSEVRWIPLDVSNPKCGFLPNVKEITELSGGVLVCAAQEILKIDAEIRQKGHWWMDAH